MKKISQRQSRAALGNLVETRQKKKRDEESQITGKSLVARVLRKEKP